VAVRGMILVQAVGGANESTFNLWDVLSDSAASTPANNRTGVEASVGLHQAMDATTDEVPALSQQSRPMRPLPDSCNCPKPTRWKQLFLCFTKVQPPPRLAAPP
jgi:hypothetical protein